MILSCDLQDFLNCEGKNSQFRHILKGDCFASKVKVAVTQSCSTLRPQGLEPARLLCPWDSPGKNTRVGCHTLLQWIVLTQGSDPGLLHCRQILDHLSYLGGPCFALPYFKLSSH